MNAWTALMSGLVLLIGMMLGALLCAWWLHHKSNARQRPPAQWPMRARRLLTGNEDKVWRWLGNSFRDHVVLVKIPVLRFTTFLDTEKTSSAATKAETRAERARWSELLNGIYTTFTVCTTDGKVVGCVDVSGKPTLTIGNRELKETLLSDCGIVYIVVNESSLPSASNMRTAFLGEMPIESTEHQVTHGGDSEFYADLNTFTKQEGVWPRKPD